MMYQYEVPISFSTENSHGTRESTINRTAKISRTSTTRDHHICICIGWKETLCGEDENILKRVSTAVRISY